MFAGIILREIPMQTINIFLASSSELKAERDAFLSYVHQQSAIHLKAKKTLLDPVHWENYIDAVALKGKQAEYNESIETCHMVVCLFHRKAGQYTVEEFETALGLFEKKHGALAAGVAATLEEGVRRDAIKSMRGAIAEPEHRFFTPISRETPGSWRRLPKPMRRPPACSGSGAGWKVSNTTTTSSPKRVTCCCTSGPSSTCWKTRGFSCPMNYTTISCGMWAMSPDRHCITAERCG